jgi:hypothetical protein
MSISASKQFLQIAKRNLSNFEENSVIPFRIKILRHLSALSTKFYTRNVRHASFSFEIRPAKLKTQSLGEFYEISVISFRIEILPRLNALSTLFYTPNVLHVHFLCRNNPCKSQNAIFQISTKSLSSRSGLTYYGI